MKKVVKLLIISLLALATAFSLVACDTANGKTTEKGVSAKKLSGDDFYTVTGYVAEDGVTSLDIIRAVHEKYGEDIVVGRIRTGSFDGNDTLTEIIVKDETENGTLTIDKGAFKNMRALEKITLPFVGMNAISDAYYNESEPALGDALKAKDSERLFGYIFGEEESDYGSEINQAYGDTDSMKATFYIPATLREVTIDASDEINIPMYGFYGVSGVTAITLKGSVKAIGVAAFKNTKGLRKLNIPASVTVIYENAFDGAESLRNFSIDADSALTAIKASAFKGTNLRSFDISGTQVEEIGDYAFFGSLLEEFKFSAAIKTIGVYAFANCKNLTVEAPAGAAVGINAFAK
ncbi:MAG: leucine-rich repeat protein [Clostridia bacterium]|nr:leucine-rich repeat protein [Clostridia bacterium]